MLTGQKSVELTPHELVDCFVTREATMCWNILEDYFAKATYTNQ